MRNPDRISARIKAFVARWRDRLSGPAREIGTGPVLDGVPLYHEGWATDGRGSHIDIIGVPDAWCDQLDVFLEDLLAREPDARIFQLKLKFGGIRLYLKGASDEAQQRANELAEKLYDAALIY